MANPKIKEEEDKPRNKGGRPKGSRGRPISRLRRTLNKLYELEQLCQENISLSVDKKRMDKEGKPDKDLVENSKWVINALVNLNRAALAEEQARIAYLEKQQAKEGEDEKEDDEDLSPPPELKTKDGRLEMGGKVFMINKIDDTSQD